jgi:hypothetical protein
MAGMTLLPVIEDQTKPIQLALRALYESMFILIFHSQESLQILVWEAKAWVSKEYQ